MNHTTIRLSTSRADEYPGEANRVRVQTTTAQPGAQVFIEMMRPGIEGSVYGYMTADEARGLIVALRGALAVNGEVE